jgi:hypothetical protein
MPREKNPTLETDLSDVDLRTRDGYAETLMLVIRDRLSGEYARMNALQQLQKLLGFEPDSSDMPHTNEERLAWVDKVGRPALAALSARCEHCGKLSRVDVVFDDEDSRLATLTS